MHEILKLSGGTSSTGDYCPEAST